MAQEAPPETGSLVEEMLPEALQGVSLLGMGLWQWIGSLLVLVGAFAVSWVLTWIAYRLIRRLVAHTDTSLDDRLLDLGIRPARYLLALALFSLGTTFLHLPSSIHEMLRSVEKGLAVALLLWLLVRLVDLGATLVEERFQSLEQTDVLALVPLGRKVAKVALIAVGLLAVLQNLGFNVTGVLAGLGVGGLAIALAAKSTVENLFGGATILADRPVRVGDFCKFGDKVGTVEEIGIRSTRVRSLDRTLITIPNADFSQNQIENFGARDRIRLILTIGLRYETSPDQLRHVLVGLRRILLAHPRVDRVPARVRFVGFGAYSLDLEVFAYVLTSDWNEFLGVREDIFLRFMDVVKESGTGFAFPSQTAYLGRDTGLDARRTEDAEAEVERWRAERRLPFPAFSTEAIDEMDDTLEWPPQGSMSQGLGESSRP